jgi:IS605 OrfB family transposase
MTISQRGRTRCIHSKNRRRARVLVAKAHRRIRNKRGNFHHQEARKVVDRHGAIAIEGLRIKNMVRNPCLSKSISDAGWNQFLTILTSKAEEAGLAVVVVNPAGTSQVCSGCGRVVPKSLSDRWHTCPYRTAGYPSRGITTALVRFSTGPDWPVLRCNPQQNPLPSGMGSVTYPRRRPPRLRAAAAPCGPPPSQ